MACSLLQSAILLCCECVCSACALWSHFIWWIVYDWVRDSFNKCFKKSLNFNHFFAIWFIYLLLWLKQFYFSVDSPGAKSKETSKSFVEACSDPFYCYVPVASLASASHPLIKFQYELNKLTSRNKFIKWLHWNICLGIAANIHTSFILYKVCITN